MNKCIRCKIYMSNVYYCDDCVTLLKIFKEIDECNFYLIYNSIKKDSIPFICDICFKWNDKKISMKISGKYDICKCCLNKLKQIHLEKK